MSVVPNRQFLAYAAVGTVGFVIDASVLTLLTTHFDFGLLAARGASFTTATLSTWLLNRVAVFAIPGSPKGEPLAEYARYLLVQTAGAVTNLSVFFALVRLNPELAGAPILPLAAGAACALGITYAGSRRFVFPGRTTGPTDHDCD